MPLVCNIRGTGGAGKSHLVRTIVDEAKRQSNDWYEWYQDGRKRPLATEVRFPSGGLFVPGHYQVPCGGCDTLGSIDEAYELVKQGAERGYNVLFEGIIVMDDIARAIEISRQMDLVVIGLTTPLDACLEAVGTRRNTRGTVTAFDPSNTIDRARRCSRGLSRLKASKVKVLMMTRGEALDWCRTNLLKQSDSNARQFSQQWCRDEGRRAPRTEKTGTVRATPRRSMPMRTYAAGPLDPRRHAPRDVYPYLDNVALWLRHPVDGASIARLRHQCGHLHVDNRTATFDQGYRQRLELKQPGDEALRWVAARGDALINRVEVTLDMIFKNYAQRDDAYAFLHRHMVRRWHGRTQKIRLVGETRPTRYDAHRGAANRTVLYNEAHSRQTGELFCLHVEWRIGGADPVRKAGLSSGSLLTFDHRAFWRRRLLLVDIPLEKLARALSGSRKRKVDRTDRRAAHVWLGAYGTIQELIDAFGGSRRRLRSAFETIENEAFLPPETVRRRRRRA